MSIASQTKVLKILVVDDCCLLRTGIIATLAGFNYPHTIAEASNGIEALEQMEIQKPDIVLMDIEMPEMDGLDALVQIKTHWPDSKVIMVSASQTKRHLLEAVKYGADGYICKGAKVELLDAIETVLAGRRWFIDTSPLLKQKSSFKKLTKREREILKLIAEGLGDSEISELLNVAWKTVRCHRYNAMKKLNIHRATEIKKYYDHL